MAYGELGPTHHSIEDLVLDARDRQPARCSSRPTRRRPAPPCAGRSEPRPVLPAHPRFRCPAVTPGGRGLEPGRRDARCADGDDVTVIAIGTMVSRALDAAERAARRRDRAAGAQHAVRRPARRGRGARRRPRETRGIVTAEEATVTGGLGAAVASLRRPAPARADADPRRHRQFAPTGSASFLLEHFGLTADGIAAARGSSSCVADHILAIDQGTADQGPARRRRPARSSRRGAAPVACDTRGPAGSSSTPRRSGRSVQAAVAACLAARPGSDRRGRPEHAARVAAAVGPRDGRAARPVLSWQDQRTAPTARRCCASTSELVARDQRTAAGPDVLGDQGPLAARRATTRTAASAAASCVWHVDSWLLTSLGGEHVIEVGNASRTQLLDVRDRDWDAGAAGAVRCPARRCCRASCPRPGRSRRARASRRCRTARRSLRRAGRLARRAVRARRLASRAGQGHLRHGFLGHGPRRPGDGAGDGLCLTVAWEDEPARRTRSRATSAPAAPR